MEDLIQDQFVEKLISVVAPLAASLKRETAKQKLRKNKSESLVSITSRLKVILNLNLLEVCFICAAHVRPF